VIDPGGKAEFQMLIHDFTGQAAHVFVANTAVIRTLGSARMPVLREAEGTPALIEKVLPAQKHDPQVRVRSRIVAREVGGMRREVGMQDFRSARYNRPWRACIGDTELPV